MRLLGRAAGSASRRIFTSAVAEAKYPTLLHVDSFTKAAFSGNPAAVCMLDDKAEEMWMRNVARNQNLSETAFVRPTGSAQLEGEAGAPAKGETFELRWFTPSVEVDLCGHATMAAAHALFSRPSGRESDVLRFSTRSGELQAIQRADGLIELDFPASPPVPLRESVGPSKEDVAAALRLPEEVIDVVGASDDLLVVVPDAAIVRAVTPDLGLISRLPFRGVIVTASAGSEPPFDFSSRFFAPAVGIAEDSVTGSAHCTMAPYWGAVLGKRRMRAVGAYARMAELLSPPHPVLTYAQSMRRMA
jgi:PhzF family phenazine biosynthesis protein